MAVGPQISAPAGLPFLSGGAASASNGIQPAEIQTPMKAAIVVGGKGGGEQSGGAFDGGQGGGGQDE